MAFDVATALPVLRRTPAVLHALLAGLPEPWSLQTEGAGTWSAFDDWSAFDEPTVPA